MICRLLHAVRFTQCGLGIQGSGVIEYARSVMWPKPRQLSDGLSKYFFPSRFFS
jgi:hypothetical protein